MKPVVNSSLSKVNNHQIAAARSVWWAVKIPNFVWLAMIITAMAALSFSTLTREKAEARSAQTAYSQTQVRAQQTQAENQQLASEINRLKGNSRASRQAVRERLNYIRPNEIIVSTH